MRALAVLAVCIAMPATAQRSLTTEQYVADLEVARSQFLAAARAYTPATRAAADQVLARAIEQAASLDDLQFAYTLAQAAALADDLHTSARIARMGAAAARLPLRFYRFADGHFVTRAAPGHEDLVGARVESLGGKPLADVLQRASAYAGGPESSRQHAGAAYLHQGAFLRRLGLATPEGAVKIGLRLADGRLVERQVTAVAGGDPVERASYFEGSIEPVVEREGRRSAWAYGGPEEAALPLWMRQRNRNLVASVPEIDALYVRLDDISDGPERSVRRIAAEVVQRAKASRPAHVIVDLRGNGGGNFQLAVSFAMAMPRVPRPGGHTYVITGRATASAAISTAAYLRHFGQATTVIVGEPMADRTAFWAEGKSITLPHSKIALHAPDEYHDWERGCTDWSRCHLPAALLGVAAGPLDPQLPALSTYAQFAAGRDAALEAIIGHARRS